MLGGKRQHPLKSKLVKLRNVFFGVAAIDFVDQQQRPPRGRPQLLRDVTILGQHTGGAVDDEEDEVGSLERAPRLVADLAREGRHRRIAVLESARVRELVPAAVVERDDVRQPVACHAGHVMRERAAFAGEAIEERRLADIRASDDDDFL